MAAYYDYKVKMYAATEAPKNQGTIGDCVKQTLLRDWYDTLAAKEAGTTEQCPLYWCADNPTGWPDNTCVLYDKSIVDA